MNFALTRMRAVVAIVLFAVVLLIEEMPLSVALPMATASDSGLTARRAEGTIWSGVLREARVAGLPLGDAVVGLQPFPLLSGEARLGFASPTLKGTATAGSATIGLGGATGSIDLAGRFAPLPLGTLSLEDMSVRFGDNRCDHAEGRVRATIVGSVGGLSLPGGLSGAARCDGAALLLPLASQSGLERIDLWLTGDGHWHANLSVKAGDPALAAKLLAAGFTPGPGGLTMRVAGVL